MERGESLMKKHLYTLTALMMIASIVLSECSGFDTSIFDPALEASYQTEEGQVGLPFAVFPAAIYYVPSFFDEAGLNYPPSKYGEKYVMPDGSEVDWSWDTLRTIARLLTI